MSAPQNIRIGNGSSWPHPDRGYDAITKIGGPVSLDDDRPLTVTRADFFALREIVAAYDHLCRHPVGTEETIKVLRLLRRAVKESDDEATVTDGVDSLDLRDVAPAIAQILGARVVLLRDGREVTE